MRRTFALALGLLLAFAAAAAANHIPGSPCSDCASHTYWPTIDGRLAKTPKTQGGALRGTGKSDELLGGHGSDKLYGEGGSDVLWGDHIPRGGANQFDQIWGGDGTDFIYGSHGRNTIRAGAGNDAISVHYGRGFVDCGPGRDIYHVARSRRHRYTFKNCEKVDYRPESKRGNKGLKPLG